VRFLIVTTGRRVLLSDELSEALISSHPGAEVRRLRCDPRLDTSPGPSDLLPHGLDAGGLRWADLVMAFGSRRAGWAALPWVLGDGEDGSGAWVVLDDTFEVSGPLDGLVDFDTADVPAARALHVDSNVGAWGGFAPGLLVLPEKRSGWAAWWRQRVTEAARCPDPLVVDPWWCLPTTTRTITDPRFCLSARTAAEIEVGDDVPAPTLVDYAGLDPLRPWWFAPPGEAPAVFMSDVPGLRSLCRARAARLLSAGWTPEVDREPDPLVGVSSSAELRRWYRGQLRSSGATPPPNPLVAGEAGAFLDLLSGPGAPDGAGAGQHVDVCLADRDDLRQVFPHPRWRDRRGFRRWLWSHGLSEGVTSLVTLPVLPSPPPPTEPTAARRPFGVNLVGYLGADLGLGVAARRLQRAFDAVGIPHAAVSYDRTSSNQRSAIGGDTDRPYHFTLMLITPDQLPLFIEDVGEEFLACHHNIGLWYWEADVLSPRQMRAFDFVDEVWVATDYLVEPFESAGRVPVRVVPSPLVFDVPQADPAERGRLGLDDRFTFLFSFDFLSVAERKNPLGVADAYCRAFPDPEGGTRLLLKSINGDLFPEERERIIDAVADRCDIEVWDRLLPAADRLALVAASDCYVSLHRSEGLGLTMAEAMAAGTPVIATAYSGNLSFMDEASALLVPADIVEIGPGQHYPAHGHWAKPDLDAAAAAMRRVRDDPALRARLAAAGARALERFSFAAVGEAARDVLLAAWSAEDASDRSGASART
jgi:glycosyltransferase involved in cell wall biosynthesis